MTPVSEYDGALLRLLERLDASGFDFKPSTPATHARVLARPDRKVARDLSGVFGWSLPFHPHMLDPAIMRSLDQAQALTIEGDKLKSRVRVARVDGSLFLHSAYPTESKNAVFLGPDTYRFVGFVLAELPPRPTHIVDFGAGSGVGGVLAGLACPNARLSLVDVNPEALRFAHINAMFAGRPAQIVQASRLEGVSGDIDLMLANPPFIMDDGSRAYRDGGALFGAQLSLDWAVDAAARLSPGGRLLLYTGSAIVDGVDRFKLELSKQLVTSDVTIRYKEIDPDIFGEELSRPAYAQVDRIAAVTVVLTRPSA